MGLDIHLRPKSRSYDHSIEEGKLSRRFCNFVCGPDAFGNSEFEQLQQLLDIDLSFLRSSPVNLEPDIGELEYQLYLAEEAKDQAKMEEIQKEIKRVQQAWEDTYEEVTKGWLTLEEMEEHCQVFLEKLKQSPLYHLQLKYNFNWADYFHPARDESSEDKFRKREKELPWDISYTRNILVEDVQAILSWIAEARKRSLQYVTFEYG